MELDLILSNDIHVFVIPVNQYAMKITEFLSVLSEEERERAFRFRFKKDQDRFIVSHAVLRLLLSHYLRIEAKTIPLGKNVYGKPEIINLDTDLCFNLSHSGDYALIAFASHPVGVDIEQIDPKMGLDEIVKRFFSEKENKEYETLPREQKRLGFYQAWTRKEAYIKALGEGLVCSLKHFSVTLAPDKPAEIYEICNQCTRDWHLHSFTPDKNYCAAIAWKGNPATLIFGKLPKL